MVEIILNEVFCKKCSHKWFPRKQLVNVCPNCHSYKWNEEDGIIKVDKNISTDNLLNIMVNNPIFKEDLMIIGVVGHEKK